jgi:hypothetical protein
LSTWQQAHQGFMCICSKALVMQLPDSVQRSLQAGVLVQEVGAEGVLHLQRSAHPAHHKYI